jgi:two-component sensor histidine kinase
MPPPNALHGVDDPHAFAQAIVDTIREPLLVLDKDLRVLVASRSFYRAFNVSPENTHDVLIYELGGGEWDVPALRTLLQHVAPDDSVIEGYEVEHDFPSIGHKVMLVNARKVFYESRKTSTILVAFEDITERRAAERERDDLLRQKDMLLGEMQHRVANSLQIIASILLMKARTVGSEETRGHLRDAHTRVLAVAAVQRHLHSATGAAAVQLKPYLEQLCQSLVDAMIHDGADAVKVTVHADGGGASSASAVNLGLIVTELVINALKHAFPKAAASSEIQISYVEDARAGWLLTVSDNGVGKDPKKAAPVKAGLGTSIVTALAEQLSADVQTVSGVGGTTISITSARSLEAA